MTHTGLQRFQVAAALLLAGCLFATEVSAETKSLKATRQWGLGYLQLMVMEDKKLIEKYAAAEGLGALTVEWSTIGSAGMMNNALISGSVDLISVGPVGLATLWARTRGKQDVRAIAAMNSVPLYLLTRNPSIQSLKDFTPTDRIAVPSVQVSTQAVMLQIAAAKMYGKEQYARFDSSTVGLAHPNALTALMTGTGEITAYFSSPPFQYRAMATPGIRKITSANEILGEPVSFTNVVLRGVFCNENPKICVAIFRALEESTKWVNANKAEAADLYIKISGDKTPRNEIIAMINDPEAIFTLRPMGIGQVANFLYDIGKLEVRPNSWRDLYFEVAHGLNGS